MDSNKLGRWLTLAANIGVIAGLVLVAGNRELLDALMQPTESPRK
jgi:hypothetical protein